jgi:hypothetical protein
MQFLEECNGSEGFLMSSAADTLIKVEDHRKKL